MKIRVLFWIVGAILLSGFAVHAQTKEGRSSKAGIRTEQLTKKFNELDRNGDEKLVRDELGAKLFDFLNSNADDFVTLDEARQVIRRQGMEALQAILENRESDTATESDTAASISKTIGKSDSSLLREGPQRLPPGDYGIGRMIRDLDMQDLEEKQFRLSDFTSSKAIVIAMTNTSCPVCKKYLPTLGEIEKRFKDQSIAFIYVNATASDKLADIQRAIKTNNLTGHYVRDLDGSVATAIGSQRTTDVVLLDAKRTVVYRGAVDDQYGFGYSTDAPHTNYLVDAIEATLVNEFPLVQATSAPGCPLDLDPRNTTNIVSNITYHNRISRIVQKHCLECHRDGGVAPFSLSNYEEVAAQSGAIRQVLEKGVMPPWFAAAPAPGQASPFANDCSLAQADKSDLLQWLGGGKPEGEPNDAPVPRAFAEGWQIGKPDHVVQLPTSIAVKASGTMPYQNVTVETGLTETQYLQAIEVKPTARDVVHHILVFIAPPRKRGEKSNSREDFDETSGFFAAYAPGYDALVFNKGFGKVLPAGSRLKFQIHYTPNGSATQDRPMLGMIFAKETPQHLVDVAGIAQPRLSIPPHASNHEVVATQKLSKDATILAFFPHMHLRGKAFKYELVTPTGETKVLLDIPRYDFNWQLSYRLTEPLQAPAGSMIRATAWYDNSSGNLANPDPSRTVRWGQQTFDEMMIGYIEYHMEDGSLGRERSR